jgi:hypothetical protein
VEEVKEVTCLTMLNLSTIGWLPRAPKIFEQKMPGAINRWTFEDEELNE